ncbi:AP-4 complex subunit mu-1-like [Babylonia areolata]|uniref:AP-4 complex subunit mu-1-like n=1 Tax=Babylonia areolata TaxID=304850 RepID=UPI003FD28415
MMIAEIQIVTERSEILVRKIYRKEALTYDARAIFGKKQQDVRGGRVSPHFEEDGIHFYYIHRGSLYFLASCARDTPTIAVTEFLSRLYSIVKDLCGVVTEASVRANFLPIFEVLCDAMDNGYIQIARTERLRPFIQSEPVSMGIRPSTQEEIASRIFGIDRRVASASTAHKPAVGSAVDERGLYVDVVENLTIVTNSQGEVSHFKVEGTMVIQNQLQGHPFLKIGVNEDLQICKPGEQRVYGKSAQLDHCKFHPGIDTSEFEAKRILKIAPTIGEFSAMTYSVDGSSLIVPVLVRVSVQDIENSRDNSVTIQVSPNFPHSAEAVHVCVALPVPASVSSISQHAVGPSESLTFRDRDKTVLWTIRNLGHAQESTAHIRLISHNSKSVPKTDIGPATVEFEINRLTLSGLHLRFLKIFDGNQLWPAKRFVRYVTASDSYTVKVP